MYCTAKNRECSYAGNIKLQEQKKKGEEYYTICYKEGGRTACTLGF